MKRVFLALAPLLSACGPNFGLDALGSGQEPSDEVLVPMDTFSGLIKKVFAPCAVDAQTDDFCEPLYTADAAIFPEGAPQIEVLGFTEYLSTSDPTRCDGDLDHSQHLSGLSDSGFYRVDSTVTVDCLETDPHATADVCLFYPMVLDDPRQIVEYCTEVDFNGAWTLSETPQSGFRYSNSGVLSSEQDANWSQGIVAFLKNDPVLSELSFWKEAFGSNDGPWETHSSKTYTWSPADLAYLQSVED